MKVFISWSGAKSRGLAEALRDWLPSVVQAVEPFVSAQDIYTGARWQDVVSSQLDASDFGLICIAKENLSAPWLNFEAGAIAKSVTKSRVVPVAIDLSFTDIPPPLGQFQACRLEKKDIHELVKSMNEACDRSIGSSHLSAAIEKWWPELEEALVAPLALTTEVRADAVESRVRTDRDLLEELLTTVRSEHAIEGPLSRRRNDNRAKFDVLQEEIGPILSRAGHSGWSYSMNPSGPFKLTVHEALRPSTVQQIEALEDQLGVGIDIAVEEPGNDSGS